MSGSSNQNRVTQTKNQSIETLDPNNVSVDFFNSLSASQKKAIVAKLFQNNGIPSIPIIEQPLKNDEEDESNVTDDFSSSEISSNSPPDSMIPTVHKLMSYYNDIQTVSPGKTIPLYNTILFQLRPFYNHKSVSMKVRKLLFLSKEHSSNMNVLQYIKFRFQETAQELIHIKPLKTKHWCAAINGLTSSLPYDEEADYMQYSWRQQFSFETSIYNSDKYLASYTSQFFNLIDPKIRWAQLNAFSKEISKYYCDQYKVYPMPQLRHLASRALHSQYIEQFGELFPYNPTSPAFIAQLEKMRNLTPLKLQIHEKFIKDGVMNTPLRQCNNLFPVSVGIATSMSFATIPEDLFAACYDMHESLLDEIVYYQYQKTDKKETLSEFKRHVSAIGQEDIMPIIILVLVLAEIPNIEQICNFFNDYSIQLQNNTKIGLYMANITLAYGAIQNWIDFN